MNKILWTALLGLIIRIGSAYAEPAPYFYVVAADPQLFFKQKDDAHWRKTIGLVNGLKPDFMIVCGDLIQGPNKPAAFKTEEVDKLADAYLKGAAELKGIPIYNVAGNHDVTIQPNEKTLTWYESRFGKPWYAFEHKSSLFIVLESNLIRDPSGAPEHGQRQWDWLDRTLAESKAKTYAHKTVYMHHPLCLKSVDEKSGYFNIPLKQRQALLKRLHDHGFAAAFCGHYHRNAYVKDGDLELVTTSSCGAALGKDPLGFRIVKVYPDRLEHAYFGFETLPAKVELETE